MASPVSLERLPPPGEAEGDDSAAEFIRRFLLHALPPGFPRIRYYGLMANRHRAAKLKQCRQLLAGPLTDPLPRRTDYRDFYAALTGKNLKRVSPVRHRHDGPHSNPGTRPGSASHPDG